MRDILLVEDDRITSRLIQKYILDLGYNVTAAVTSGDEALKQIELHEPDLVLMDINLQGEFDGIEYAKNINFRFATPFVYITSSSDISTIERAKESNAYGYIIKPFDKKDLRAVIEMALLRHDLDRKMQESENRVSTILNTIIDSVVVYDENGKIDYVNDSSALMLGKGKAEMMGRPISEVIKISIDPREEGEGFSPMSMSYVEFNNYLTTETGKIPVDFTSTPILQEDGRKKGAVLLIKNITQQVEYDKKIKESLEALLRTMYGTIEAMTKAVETRDPYTAGHQKKVADIAREIAKDMRLSREVVESVNLAGQIHDLGKIAVPAEILSKPGRISESEFNLIKSHPQLGFDILKNIDFPWPIAEIVLQHHEKLDGSGYPRGLQGDDILIQARILSVADIVEAMASHRPYRAALGIDLALEEVQRLAGTALDRDVVMSCVKIFKDENCQILF
jgi:PAS domain S-box-containing protein/putative nucleotidyltransferase with HDIG domain